MLSFRRLTFSVLLLLLTSSSVHSFAQSFSNSGNLNTTRFLSTTTTLNNGSVLVAGGGPLSTSANTAELYNPASSTSTYTGDLVTGRYAHTATLLPNGTVLIVGGVDVSGNTLMSAEIYNPSSGTFSATGAPNVARQGHTATLLRNGLVLIAGGPDASAELYNPTSGTFSLTGSMTSARVSHTATLLGDGTVLITGGDTPNSNTALGTAEIFNPSTSAFSPVGNLTTPRSSHTASLLSDGTVLVAGGANGGTVQSTAELYSPATQSFSATGSMSAPRATQTATVLEDGTVLLAGGNPDDSGDCSGSADLYTVGTGAFQATGSLPSNRCGATATLLNSGDALLVGGTAGSGSYLATTVQYSYPLNSGSIDPKYVVVSVAYAPPGSRSSVSYGSSTLIGTSSSISNTFMNTVGVSSTFGGSTGIFGLGAMVSGTASTSYTQESDTSTSFAVNTTTTNGVVVPGPANSADGLDHDYDVVFVWLNPKVNVTVGVTPNTVLWNGYSYDPRDPLQDLDVVPIYVYCLKDPTSTALGCTDVQSRLARSWDTSGLGGLTSTDLATILSRDPFASNPSYNPATDASARYDLQQGEAINYAVAAPGGQPITYTQSAVSQATTTAGQGASDSYQVGFSLDASFKGGFLGDITADLKSSNTTTWMNKWSTTDTQTVGQTAALSITGPASTDNYTGPTAFQLWKDNVYGTFMFYAPTD